MKIKWLGRSTFKIESKTTLVTDPHNPEFGKLPKDLVASVVTVSHAHADHNYVEGLVNQPQIINQTGDFVVDGFRIKGVATFHDNSGGKKRGDNIVYIFRCEGLSLCHLGDLGHILNDNQLKEIGNVDILMIPVGGYFTIEPNEAVQVVNQIKPKVVLPMHYKTPNDLTSSPLAGVNQFVEALNWDTSEILELDADRVAMGSIDRQIIILK